MMIETRQEKLPDGKISKFFGALREKSLPLTRYVTLFVLILVVWTLLYALFPEDAEPNGPLFSLVLLCIVGYASGQILKLVLLPPLLGMMLCGMVLANVGMFEMTGIYAQIIVKIRDVALLVIVLMAGFDIDMSELKQMSWLVTRLAVLPCIAEAISVAAAAYFLMNMPLLWGSLLGAVLGAVSPAILVPSLMHLKEKGYGRTKGISTLLIAACGMDDIVAIASFGIVLGMIFSTGELVKNILHGPIELVAGIVLGLIWGFVAGLIPYKDEEYLTCKRSLMIGGGGFAIVLLSTNLDYTGIGPLAALVSSAVACQLWKSQQTESNCVNPVAEFFEQLWSIMEPLLFGLMGTDIRFEHIDRILILHACIILAIATLIRIMTSLVILNGANLSRKEILFVTIAWLPKATVQAALGPIALELAINKGLIKFVPVARQVLTIAVVSILITAPLGAISIIVGGPKLLTRDRPNADENENDTVEKNEIP